MLGILVAIALGEQHLAIAHHANNYARDVARAVVSDIAGAVTALKGVVSQSRIFWLVIGFALLLPWVWMTALDVRLRRFR